MTIEQDIITNHLEASEAPRIFSLVVGIDKYEYKSEGFGDLTGCKNDGKRFVNFLTEVLSVPLSQIVFLADEEATRQEIVNQFNQFLIENEDIQRNDAIIFFFAGHGSQLVAPQGWLTDSNKIETLCSHDYRTTGDDGKEILGISDRAIDALMRRLAFEKGDNIVAIFDCCHSGGLSRSEENTRLRTRSLPPPPDPAPADLDREIWSSLPEPCARAAHTVIQTGFQYKAMASHILLAACRPGEAALEDPDAKNAPGGLFTTALIEGLRRSTLHDTSYNRLFETLDLKHNGQHPQCEGTNRDRLLFSVNTLRNGRTTAKVSERGNKLWVSAGSIHGIVDGAAFTVVTSTQRLVLKAKKVRAFETMLEGRNHKITNAEAFVSNGHHPTLRVHSSSYHSSTHLTIVPANEPADIDLHQDGLGKWVLKRFDPLIRGYADHSIQVDADARRMEGILEAVANFNFYLYRSDGAAASHSGKVNIQLKRIEETQGEYGPVGDDLLEVPTSSRSGVELREATITDLGPRYGFTLENHSEVDLFPYLFYFDPSDYSVQAWYTPPSSTMLAPLKRRNPDGAPSLLAVGYGGFGTDPIEFYLPPGCQTDSGFLKVFLATTHADMANVAQPPIDEISSSRVFTGKYPAKGVWTCETFVLTCKEA
ncbi:caspase domain-containing protein [Boletus coccyginus]|nr:caspase domain-containing protein [Boletus coccyginus]